MFFGALYWQCGLQGSYKVDQRHRVAEMSAFGRRRHGLPSAGRLIAILSSLQFNQPVTYCFYDTVAVLATTSNR